MPHHVLHPIIGARGHFNFPLQQKRAKLGLSGYPGHPTHADKRRAFAACCGYEWLKTPHQGPPYTVRFKI